MAVLGSEGFDAHDIDISTLALAGATPLRFGYRDVATPPGDDVGCTCAETGADGYADLVLEFSRLDVVAGLGSISGGSMPVTLTGRLMDGTSIVGADCVRIVPGR